VSAVTSLLALRLRPEAVADAPEVLRRTLTATRAFAGCLGVEVTVDATDETHVVVVEHWESLEADDAYRAWRATPDGTSDLGTLLAEPPVLTRLHVLPGV
jgi:quinol monooxygenase YgiN